jgi:hypothetical protein
MSDAPKVLTVCVLCGHNYTGVRCDDPYKAHPAPPAPVAPKDMPRATPIALNDINVAPPAPPENEPDHYERRTTEALEQIARTLEFVLCELQGRPR